MYEISDVITVEADGPIRIVRLNRPEQLNAVETTKRIMNIHLERAVLATIDFALAGEYESFATDDVRAFLDRPSN